MRAYQAPGRPPCHLDGCTQPLYCRGLCTMHYPSCLDCNTKRRAA